MKNITNDVWVRGYQNIIYKNLSSFMILKEWIRL